MQNFFYVWSADLPPVRATYERATYGLRESNFTILTCNCCADSARSTCVPRTVLASSVLTSHFPVDLLNDHAEHTCTIPVYKDDLTGDCQLVSKMPRKAQMKTTRQDPKKQAAEDTRAASDDEVRPVRGNVAIAQRLYVASTYNSLTTCATYDARNRSRPGVSCRPRTYTLRNRASDLLPRPVTLRFQKNVADVASQKTYGQKALTSGTGCGGDLTAPSGGPVTSPNYPSNYGRKENCEWSITVPEGSIIILTFDSFDTERNYDFLSIYDGASDNAAEIKRLTGDQSQIIPIISTSNTMFLRFTSDLWVSRQGFQFNYTSSTAGQCWDPGVPANGNRDNNSNFTSGQTVRYTCMDGYPLRGTANITCQPNGTWSGSTPTCGGNR
ncbi:hypothetical protein Bbelb_254180 [Branchiostoma belcheri]|nr:hypothetical protein Bbelb_254180 [Branchiostoma belcheri]